MVSNDNFIGFVAGVLSGITKLVVGHPFDTIKVRLQTSLVSDFKGPWHCLQKTLKSESLRGLYKGSTPPLIGWALMDSVQMGTLTNARLLLAKQGKLSLSDHAKSGLAAGIVVSFVATPIEVLKARLQIQYQNPKSPISIAKELIQESGIRGLYRGLDGCLLFRSWFWLLWSSYEIYTQKFLEWGMSPTTVPFFAGGMAANTFWAVSFPFDVIKNSLMTRTSASPYTNILNCAQFILKTRGIKGFYRGFVPTLLRSFPTNASAIFVFETSSRLGKQILDAETE